MREIYKEIEDLQKNGFTHIKNIFSSKNIFEVKHIIDSIFDRSRQTERPNIKSLSTNSNDIAIPIKEINHALWSDFRLKKTDIFIKCQEVASVFLGKKAYVSFDHVIYKPKNSGIIHWHQDQAYKTTVKKMSSIHFWIPLQHTPKELGCMKYVSKSHMGGICTHKVDLESGTKYIEDKDIALSRASYCPADLGDAIAHLPETVHGSDNNVLEATRGAWIIHFGPYGYYEIFLPRNIKHNVERFLNNENKND